MPKRDFRSPRLFIEAPLVQDAAVPLDRAQANYLGNVLRLGEGDTVLAFNGRDGEWQAAIAGGKRPVRLTLLAQTRPQDASCDLTLAFAPLKHARLDYVAQKAVELGASRLQPVITRFTQVTRLNTERMRANAIEAAEQCGILTLAEVAEPQKLAVFLDARDATRLLVFCDEDATAADPVVALAGAGDAAGIDVVIGPEGGFADDERALLLRQHRHLVLSLGPRIMRADTAAVAALTLVQAVLGDFRAR